MASQAIEPDRWSSFCASFSAQHHGWRASLWVARAGSTDAPRQGDRQGDRRYLVREAEFQSLAPDTAGDPPGLSVELGRGDAHFAHHISDPRRLLAEQDADGAHRGIRIETAGGDAVVLAFRSATRPEAVDGFAGGGP